MPAIANKLSTILQLKVKTGTDEEGKDILATQSFRRVKTDALDDDIYAIAQAIDSMESTPLVSVAKQDTYELVNQA
ncbi:MAG: DUF1659 domain-containing protein [Clostridiales bacterium]|nr:DUF1659 domain-containing protein [Clostridiales bacterium]HBM80480.1 hypothetical protein [Clostridiaceae bacterium]